MCSIRRTYVRSGTSIWRLWTGLFPYSGTTGTGYGGVLDGVNFLPYSVELYKIPKYIYRLHMCFIRQQPPLTICSHIIHCLTIHIYIQIYTSVHDAAHTVAILCPKFIYLIYVALNNNDHCKLIIYIFSVIYCYLYGSHYFCERKKKIPKDERLECAALCASSVSVCVPNFCRLSFHSLISYYDCIYIE